MSTLADPRERIKTFLATYLVVANITNDAGAAATVHIRFGDNKIYLLKLEFYGTKNNDVVFTIEPPESEAIFDHDGQIIGYNEKVPVYIYAINKTGITADKILWKAEQQLRYALEQNWLGSFFGFNSSKQVLQDAFDPRLYCIKTVVTYERDVSPSHTGTMTLTYGHGYCEDFAGSLYGSTIYTAEAGSTDVIIHDDTLTEAADFWNGRTVKMLTGTYAGVIRKITDFTTPELTVDAFAGAIVAGDTFQISNWQETEDGNTATCSISDNDFLDVTVSASAGNKKCFYSYPSEAVDIAGAAIHTSNLNLSSSVYQKILWRYKTGNTTIKAKIVLVFSTWDYTLTEAQNIAAGNGQIVHDDTASTSLTFGSTTVTAAKIVDHIRFYADNGVGGGATTDHVYYDFALLCMGNFTIPNCRYGFTPKLVSREALLKVFGMSGAHRQGGGSELSEFEFGCDVTKGNWKRINPADAINGEVFYDIEHNAKSEPWQWFSSGTKKMKVNLVSFEPPQKASGEQLDLRINFTLREYRASDAGIAAETYRTRWGIT